jgi:hypothetical protein
VAADRMLEDPGKYGKQLRGSDTMTEITNESLVFGLIRTPAENDERNK